MLLLCQYRRPFSLSPPLPSSFPPPPSLLLLQALGDIQIALSVLGERERDERHPVDRHYHALKCALAPLEHDDEMFKVGQEPGFPGGSDASQLEISSLHTYTLCHVFLVPNKS